MDPKELRGLMEAYVEVYAPQEEIEEGLRSAVKRLLGGGKKEAEAPKPESRGAELRRRYNVGPERSDTSAKRQILDRSRARAERDEKEFGGSKYSKTVAQKSKAAHDRYLKAGYSKYGADDARGSGNKARKRAAALNREEFEFIVNALIDEGYDLSSYTWDEMYEICLDEAVKGESSERRKDLAAERRAGHRPKSAKEGERYASHKLSQMAYAKRQRMGEELDIFDVVLEFLQAEGYAETLEEAEWMMANMIDEEAIGIIAELTGGKGHPGYKAGSRDLGPMQSGHPADTFKRTMKGGTMSQRHGDHLGDLDDKDDDEDDLEAGLKDTARKKRENVRKPLRDKVRSARKVLSKEEYVDEGHGSRRSFKTQSGEERRRISMFGKNYEPHKNYDPEANRGQGQILRPNQAEKQRRKKLAKSAMGGVKEAFNIFINTMISEGMNFNNYSWDDLYEMFDNIFEADVANRDPDAYERRAQASETRGQSAERRVRNRLATMDPAKRDAMIKQMRAVGLNV